MAFLILLVLYYTVYIPAKKEAIQARKFNALKVAAEQFEKNLEDNQKVIKAVNQVIKQQVEREENEDSFTYAPFATEDERKLTEEEKKSKEADNKTKEAKAKAKLEGIINKMLEGVDLHQDDEELYLLDDFWLFDESAAYEDRIASSGTPKFDSLTHEFILHDGFTVGADTNDEDPSFGVVITYRVPVESMVHGLLPQEEFEHYLIYRAIEQCQRCGSAKDSSKAETVAGKRSTSHELVYQSTKTNIGKAALDTLSASNARTDRHAITALTLNGIPSMVYDYPLNIDGLSGWSISAITPEQHYLDEVRALPMPTFYMLLTLGLLLLLLLPVIKLAVIGPYERIHVSDVSWSISTLVLGASLGFLLLIHAYYSWHTRSNLRTDQLTAFSSSIRNAFDREIKDIEGFLTGIDSSLSQDPIQTQKEHLKEEGRSDFHINMTKGGLTHTDEHEAASEFVDTLNEQGQLRQLARMNQRNTEILTLSWLNDKGEQQFKWATSDNMGLKISVAKRPYFQRMKTAAEEAGQGAEVGMFLESLRSWVTRDQMAVISLPSDVVLKTHRESYTVKVPADTIWDFWYEEIVKTTKEHDSIVPEQTIWDTMHVLAASVRLGSLFDPLVPIGYEFAVIRGEDGQMLFHSDEKNNQRSKLLGEGDRPVNYVAALQSGEPTEFEALVNGRSRTMYIQPLLEHSRSDLFLVTMVDSEHFDSTLGLALSSTLTLLLLFFGCFALILLLLWALQRQPSMLKASHLPFDWLRPSSGNRIRYRQVLAHQVFTLAFLGLAYFLSQGSLELILLVLIANLHTFWANYILIHRSDKPKTLLGLFWEAWSRNRYIVLLFVLLEVLLLFLCVKYGWFYWVSSYVIGFAIVLMYFGPDRSIGVRWLKRMPTERYSYVKEYRLQAFVWILISGAISTLIFYQVALRFEERTIVRYTQDGLLDALERKISCYCPELGSCAGGYGCYNRFYYNTRFVPFDSTNQCMSTEADQALEGLFGLIRPYLYSHPTVDRNNQFFDRNEMLRTPLERRVHVSEKSDIPVEADSVLYATVKGGPLVYTPPVPFLSGGPDHAISIFWLWLLFALAATFIYTLLRHMVSKLFTVEFPLPALKEEFDQNVIIGSAELKRIFWIGLPHSGRLRYLKDHYKGRDSIAIIDLGRLEPENRAQTREEGMEQQYDKAETLIITGLEYRFRDEQVNRRKLDFLEALERQWKKRIVISSFLHPQFFIEMYEERIKDLKAQLNKRDVEINRKMERLRMLQDDYYRIMAVFQPYYRVYHPLGSSKPFANRKSEHRLAPLVKEECNHGQYLIRLGSALLAGHENLPNTGNAERDQEDLILRIQGLAQSYYRTIWAGLTWEERLIIYDLADDGLVNAKNIPILNNLVSLGLVHYDERLSLMNDSFRNFVLTIVKPEDALRLEWESKRFGNWNLVRLPLIMLTTALLIFIFFIQPHVFESVLGLMTGLAAGLPFLVRMLSSINLKGGVHTPDG